LKKIIKQTNHDILKVNFHIRGIDGNNRSISYYINSKLCCKSRKKYIQRQNIG